jgi:hypothetical protein
VWDQSGASIKWYQIVEKRCLGRLVFSAFDEKISVPYGVFMTWCNNSLLTPKRRAFVMEKHVICVHVGGISVWDMRGTLKRRVTQKNNPLIAPVALLLRSKGLVIGKQEGLLFFSMKQASRSESLRFLLTLNQLLSSTEECKPYREIKCNIASQLRDIMVSEDERKVLVVCERSVYIICMRTGLVLHKLDASGGDQIESAWFYDRGMIAIHMSPDLTSPARLKIHRFF